MGPSTSPQPVRTNTILIIYLGWLKTANEFDWSTGVHVSQKQKRAVPDGSIVINCQPEKLKATWNNDYSQGIYYDIDVGEHVLQTPAVDACKEPGTVDQPILLAQKSAAGQNTFYTIFICKTAKATFFKPYLTIYTYMQS